jgi:uncharacterized repeat protein (TIGR01451 family)
MRATRFAALLAALAAGIVLVATVSAKDNPPGVGTVDAPGLNKDATTEESSAASESSPGSDFEPGDIVGPGDHVPICHALGEENKDTFIALAPSAGVVFGHADAGHQNGEDIIPPFTYVDNQGVENTTLEGGWNWTAANIEIWEDNCGESTEPPPPPPGQGSLKVVKDFTGTASSDTAKVKLQIDTVDQTGEVGDGGQTAAVNVTPGDHSVGETAGAGTDLGKYDSSISCKKGETTVESGSGASLSGIPVGDGDVVVCTVTNSPKSNGGGGGGGGGQAAAPVLDLSIAKSASPTQVTVGGTIAWTVTVTNNGATGASNVNVIDTLPGGVTLVSATPSQGSCSGTSCSLGSLAAGASATITIVTTATAAGELLNSATVSASQAETTTTNNTATAVAAAVAPGVFRPPALRCGSIKVGIKQLSVGKKTVLRIVVKNTRGKLMKGKKVTVKGSGVSASGKTGKSGVVRIAIKPTKPGVLRISAGSVRCSKRIGVLGAFQPPLTG